MSIIRTKRTAFLLFALILTIAAFIVFAPEAKALPNISKAEFMANFDDEAAWNFFVALFNTGTNDIPHFNDGTGGGAPNVPAYTGVTALDISNTGIKTMAWIAWFPNITEIDVSGNPALSGLILRGNMTNIDCSGCELYALPELPGDLTALDCSDNNLSTLPVLPGNLTTLDCSGNNLTSLPTLPGPNPSGGLQTLNCSDNPLGDAGFPDALPGSLTALDCSDTGLTELPTLTNLTELNCSGNSLTELPTLPGDLTSLDCSGNDLTSLPTLPPDLAQLYCADNELTELPNMAYLSALTILDYSNNRVAAPPALPPNADLTVIGADAQNVSGVGAVLSISARKRTAAPIVPVIYDAYKTGDSFNFKVVIANADGPMIGAKTTIKVNDKYSTTVTIGQDGVGHGTLEAPNFSGTFVSFSGQVNGVSSGVANQHMLLTTTGKVIRN